MAEGDRAPAGRDFEVISSDSNPDPNTGHYSFRPFGSTEVVFTIYAYAASVPPLRQLSGQEPRQSVGSAKRDPRLFRPQQSSCVGAEDVTLDEARVIAARGSRTAPLFLRAGILS